VPVIVGAAARGERHDEQHFRPSRRRQAGKPWLAAYPEIVPAELPPLEYASLAELLDKSCARYADRDRVFQHGQGD
jgi:hypothetical protein